jgi:tetratricopeptide (TPR) repeat protein
MTQSRYVFSYVFAIVSALLLPASAVHAEGSVNPKAMRAFQDGRTMCMAGHNLEAIKCLSQAIDEEPQYVDALIERGIAYEQVERLDDAEEDESRAIAIKPENYVAFYNRANIRFKLKQYDKAAADYKTVATLLPQRAKEMAVCQGTVWDAAGQFGKAAELYAVALKFGKDSDIEAKRAASLRAAREVSSAHKAPKQAGSDVAWSPSEQGVVEWSGTTAFPRTVIDATNHNQPEARFANAGQFLSATPFSAAVEQATGSKNPQAYFLTQAFDPHWNPTGPKRSKNCGPASLAMAYLYFGRRPPDGDPNNAEQFIEATRIAMTGADDNGGLTNFHDVVRGAEAGGLRTKIVRDKESIDGALAQGAIIIASGCPNMPGSYGQRFGYNGGTYGHFILVTNKDADGYIISDPLNKGGPTHVSSEELDAFLSYWPNLSLKGGIAIWQ